MPIARVQTPDGKIAKLEVPEGTTPEQVTAFVERQFSASKAAPKQKESLGRTIFDQGMQGATFGFADEVADWLGAGVASVVTGQPYKDLLQEARALTTERQERQFDQRPGVSIAANVAGGLATGIAGGATKAGTALSNSLRTGSTAARVGKGAVTGAVSGAAFGAGTAEDGERGEGAVQGAVLGGVSGAALPAIAAAGRGVNKALGKKPVIPNSDQLRQRASELYKVANQKGGVLKAELTDNFVDEVEKLKPQTDIGKIVGGDTPFTKVVEKIGGIRGRPMSLEAAQELDELLGEAIDGFTDAGKLTKQGKKLLDVQSSLRNMIEEADESLVEGGKAGFDALKQGRKLWSTSRKLADIERIIQRAEMTDNPATGIKSGFRTLLNNPNRLKGYTKAEQEAIKKAAESGVVTDLLRTAGSRLIPIIAGSTGGLGAAAAGQATSLASRSAATAVQVSKANRLAELVANQGVPVVREGMLKLPASLTSRIPQGVKSNPLAALIAGEQAATK